MAWFYGLDPQDKARLRSIDHRLERILANQEIIMATADQMKTKLEAVLSKVAEETTAIGGMEKVLDNLAGIITQLKLDAAKADIDPGIVAQIDALDAAVSGNKERILSDIVKNTPEAAPAVPATPAPSFPPV